MKCPSGYRSEDKMKTLYALILGTLFATFATSTVAAQSVGFQNNIVSASVGVDAPRPRIVPVAAKPATVNIASVEHLAFDLLNKRRIDNGLSPLVWNEEVAALAREHSADMAIMRYFSHKDLNGGYVSDRADSHGIKKWIAIGENIAYNKGYKDPIEKAVELWMTSDSHRHNLMDPSWSDSAVGVAVADDGSYFFTQVFLKRK